MLLDKLRPAVVMPEGFTDFTFPTKTSLDSLNNVFMSRTRRNRAEAGNQPNDKYSRSNQAYDSPSTGVRLHILAIHKPSPCMFS